MIEQLSSHSDFYSDWHPHFTPEWLSVKLANYLPADLVGTIIDPACGSGNLLAAAILRTKASTRTAVTIEGIDSSVRSARECNDLLSRMLPGERFRVLQRNFLTLGEARLTREPAYVIMNPPFRGYGLLSNSTRKLISSRTRLAGRFNLAYAFIYRAITLFQPQRLVSLLPSNWMHSKGSRFRSDLDGLSGVWRWEDIGGDAFDRVDVDVGVLVWEPGSKAPNLDTAKRTRVRSAEIAVRHGVATGSDATFSSLASMNLSFGTVMAAARGREVGRATVINVWVPPRRVTPEQVKAFHKAIGSSMKKQLRARRCVKVEGKELCEYHEPVPNWFTSVPKLLVPRFAVAEVMDHAALATIA